MFAGWTETEDVELLRAVHQVMIGNSTWENAVHCLKEKNLSDCQSRWTTTLWPTIRKTRYSSRTLFLIAHGARLYGRKEWHKVKKFVKGLNSAQLEIGWGVIARMSTPYERDLHEYGAGRITLHALRAMWDDKLVDDDETEGVIDRASLPILSPSTSSTSSAPHMESRHSRMWCSHPCTLLYALLHAKKEDCMLSTEHSSSSVHVIPPSPEAVVLSPTFSNSMHLRGHVSAYPIRRDIDPGFQ